VLVIRPLKISESINVSRLLLISVFILGLLAGNYPINGEENTYSTTSLFMSIFSNGNVLVQHDVKFTERKDSLLIQLLGGNITSLTVNDFNGTQLLYHLDTRSSQLSIEPKNSTQIRITYETPNLVDKRSGIWTFSVNSYNPFNVKLPNDAVVTDLGNTMPTLIRRLGAQELLAFNEGNVSINYSIGFFGTRDQAAIAIDSAQIEIAMSEKFNQGIKLDKAKEYLNHSVIALNTGNFVEAEKLGNNATDMSRILARDFQSAKKTIQSASLELDEAQKKNWDTSKGAPLLSTASSLFNDGNYTGAYKYALLAVSSKSPKSMLDMTIIYYLAIPLIVIGGFFYFYKKSSQKANNSKQDHFTSSNEYIAKTSKEEKTYSVEKHASKEFSNEQNMDIDRNYSVPENIETRFREFVHNQINERKNLKQDDANVLYFLADKEGAAFESEIRTKFILPKTSLWRLLKRLEREDLVEVTKLGGQNLIKLKIEM
jgi:uncharacterized membrane protein